ncbi:D-aminoacyl-tRNA deacylase [Archaeoglobus neptunius]|uniref:D-aminoacyl-tRNA deacylase n=1 Tax=Archaeoglobus neptunius TaxID=2798580 RepID=UPI0019262CBF|nr:D-aminoacyl-tRNA deacylase [Archaeoglobus neptunius]
MKVIVCSKKDTASQNIKNILLSLESFDEKNTGEYKLYIAEDFAIAEIEERLIYADFVDLKLSKHLKVDELLFASRHSSKDGRKIFTVHVSGNIGTADFGGKPYSLAKPSPFTMKNYTLSLKEKLPRKPEFTFTLEVTHHGPSEISTPSAFYEIGSTEEEWKDEEAASIVAESLLDALKDKRKGWKVAVGVGGTHYAPRQTEIMLNTVFTFGHNFAKYTFEQLTAEFLANAIKISEAEFIVYDEKSVTSSVKNMVFAVADTLGIDVLKSKKVKKDYALSPS